MPFAIGNVVSVDSSGAYTIKEIVQTSRGKVYTLEDCNGIACKIYWNEARMVKLMRMFRKKEVA